MDRRALLLVTILLGVFATGAHAARLLATKVTWEDATGATGTIVFQGTVTDGTLTGEAYAGEVTLKVTGAVSETGVITGTLRDATGAEVGTFEGGLDAARTLIGTVLLDGEASVLFSAPETTSSLGDP